MTGQQGMLNQTRPLLTCGLLILFADVYMLVKAIQVFVA